ncbi:hypothetical protein L5515_001300 [Caenorhabditis briggsae]|uniref:Uncharacterized protein n=1 Tax=Caenorhabditis briggsae TaxID=6238 RepID=A0AAE9J3V3_CAEBR|nr:hypothetical protein L5515_001300 [Caenorhabditis briggsae]
MESELSGISNENQIAWFGFSAYSFSDCVFNAYVNSWEEVCRDEFKESLKNLNEKGRLGLLSFPFVHKTNEKVFKLMKRYCVTEIFKIPSVVTLPECRKMAIASVKDIKNQSKAEKEFAAKLETIRLLRIKIAQRKMDIDSVNGVIEVLHVMEKNQEKLVDQKKEVPMSPNRLMSPV